MRLDRTEEMVLYDRLSDEEFDKMEELVDKDTKGYAEDKAGANEGYGDVVMVSQGSSSVSEQVTSLMLDLNYPLDADVSQNLMSGIMESTRNFQAPRTSSMAFEMAGVLLELLFLHHF